MGVVVPAVEFPSAELLVGGWLRTALAGPRVVSDLPGTLTGEIVQVTRIGGPVAAPLRLDNPTMDLDCFAPTRAAADALARRVGSLLPTMRGVTTGGGVVVDVSILTGASWRPDFNSNVRRFGLTASFLIRPA